MKLCRIRGGVRGGVRGGGIHAVYGDCVCDFAFLVMMGDSRRVEHVNRSRTHHSYFRIIPAIDARRDWMTVESTFINNGIKVAKSWTDPLIGKLGRWASFISWLTWLRDNASLGTIMYGVLVEDDVVLPAHFRASLRAFIRLHPERWYFRCGTYNSCLVVRRDKAELVLQRIRDSHVAMPDDWWSWKVGGVLQDGPTKLVTQLTTFKSNIARSPHYSTLGRAKNPQMWL